MHRGATVGQIECGKHMYRTLEAHIAFYFAFKKLNFATFIGKNQIIERYLKESVDERSARLPYIK